MLGMCEPPRRGDRRVTEYETKTFGGYLLVDYRDDNMRFRKTKPSRSERAPTVYPVRVDVELNVPKIDVPTLSASLDVPEAEVSHAKSEGGLGGDEPPEWHAAVEDALDHFAPEPRESLPPKTAVEHDDLVSQMVGYVMRNAESYPDPDGVEDRVKTRLGEYRERVET